MATLYSFTHIWTQVALMAVSAEQAEDPIVTDRPDFTESSLVVPLGRVQMESGATLLRGRGIRSTSGPELLVRFGVARHWELRLGAPDYAILSSDGDRQRGWGDSSIGVKRQFGPTAGGVDWAVIAASTIPASGSRFGEGGPEGELRLCASRALGGQDSLAMMLAGFWPAEGPNSWQATASYGRALDNRWGLFLEGSAEGISPESPEMTWHAGFTYRRNPNEQWDIHFGFKVAGRRDQFLAAGYSVRR